MKKISVLTLCVVCCGLLFSQGQTSSLSVKITGLRKEGSIFVYLYNKEDGFPTKPELAFKKTVLPVSAETATVQFTTLTPGDYAVAVMHDQNGNGKIDTNFVGVPKEGLGVSNKAKGFMGPPKFKDAKFPVRGIETAIEIPVKY